MRDQITKFAKFKFEATTGLSYIILEFFPVLATIDLPLPDSWIINMILSAIFGIIVTIISSRGEPIKEPLETNSKVMGIALEEIDYNSEIIINSNQLLAIDHQMEEDV